MKTNGIAAIYKREMKSFFVSPAAYIVIAIYLLVTGWFFFSTFFMYDKASMRGLFDNMPLILAFAVPALAMRSFSEEYRSGSFEVLKTQPVSLFQIVTGKFLSVLTTSLVMVLPTIAYSLFISGLGELDAGPVVGGYIGVVFLISAFSAVGLFASSVTRNQIISLIVGFIISLALVLVNYMLILIPGSLVNVLEYLSVTSHFENFAKGLVDSRDIIYFLSLSFLALYGTYMAANEQQ